MDEKITQINEEIKTLLRTSLEAKEAKGNPVKESYLALMEKYGKISVKELLTTTSGVLLPTMVAARALLDLQNWIDPRLIALPYPVGPGEGKVLTGQVLTRAVPRTWTEGSALSVADPIIDGWSITLETFGDATFLSDLLARQSAYPVVEDIGSGHAAAIKGGILSRISLAMINGRAGKNFAYVGVKGDGAEADYTFATIDSAIGKNADKGWVSDFLLSQPVKFRTAVTTDYDKKLFYGSLNEYMMEGKMPIVMGLDVLLDPYYKVGTGQTWTADGSDYAIIGTKGKSVVWAETDPVPEVEVWREGLKKGFNVISSLIGGADDGVPASFCLISHAE